MCKFLKRIQLVSLQYFHYKLNVDHYLFIDVTHSVVLILEDSENQSNPPYTHLPFITISPSQLLILCRFDIVFSFCRV